MVPKLVFLTKGTGKHRDRLYSFEMALRKAGIEKYNLVKVSSILPPGCRIISKNDGISMLRPGEIVHCVLSENSTNKPNRLLAASIGMAMPMDENQHGYFVEHHSFGETEEVAGGYAEGLAVNMLVSIMDIGFNPNLNWNEDKGVYLIQDKLLKTCNITQSSRSDKDGLWTTVIAAAVFIPDT